MIHLNKNCIKTDCPLHPSRADKEAGENFYITDDENDMCIPILCLACKYFDDEKVDIGEILKHNRLKKKLRDDGEDTVMVSM